MQSPAVPRPDQWAKLGVEVVGEIVAGRQSRVFEATVGRQRVAIKLTDAALADAQLLSLRANAVAEVAMTLPSVVAPVPVRGRLVDRIGGWFVTASPFVAGRRPDDTVAGDVEMMGRGLSALHDAMRGLPATGLPTIAALRSVEIPDASPFQLLHGDVSSANLIVSDAGLRVLDFDECGLGPFEYDLANAIYMVCFDADVHGHGAGRVMAFRRSLVTAYADESGRSIDDALVDRLIAVRVAALGRWIGDLANAPIGIRTSTPEWLATLRDFVERHGAG